MTTFGQSDEYNGRKPICERNEQECTDFQLLQLLTPSLIRSMTSTAQTKECFLELNLLCFTPCLHICITRNPLYSNSEV